MASILIGNVYADEMTARGSDGLSVHQRRVACALSQRMFWFAEDNDIVVVPAIPSTAFLTYVASMADFNLESLSIVVPPAGLDSDSILTNSRLAVPGFIADLAREASARQIDRVFPYFSDSAVAALAHAIHAEDAMSGAGFFSQGGGTLANSKALFRSVAAGLGIQIAAGAPVASKARAEQVIRSLLQAGHSVILKQDLQASSEGNLILTSDPNVTAHGALSATHVTNTDDVSTFLDTHWHWLSNDTTAHVVIERFIEEARSVYAEFLVSESDIEFVGDGELLMAPILSGVVVPATCLTDAERHTVHAAAHQLCRGFQAIGYRGIMSVDAVVSAAGEAFLHETNSRVSGATYLHQVLAKRICGADRVILDRERWSVPSFDEALRRLFEVHLSFDFQTRRGVIVTADATWVDGTVRYAVIGVDLDDAYQIEIQLQDLFARPGTAETEGELVSIH